MKSNKSAIEITFHNEERVFSLGDRISGVIEFSAQDFPGSDHLVMDAYWGTHGFGGGEYPNTYYSKLLRLEKAGPDGISKTPFEFTVPNTYPSMRGKLVKIDHYLLVYLPSKGFFDRLKVHVRNTLIVFKFLFWFLKSLPRHPKALKRDESWLINGFHDETGVNEEAHSPYLIHRKNDFVVQSEGFELCEPNRKTDRRCSSGFGGPRQHYSHSKQVPVLRSIAFLIFCAAFLVFMISVKENKWDWDKDVRQFILILGSAVSCFFVPPLVFVILTLAKYLKLKTDDLRFLMRLQTNQTMMPGKDNSLSLTLRAKRKTSFKQFDVFLRCYEYAVINRGATDCHTASNQLLDILLASEESLVLEKNEQYDLSIPLNIEDLKLTPSFYGKDNTIEWTLVIKAKARNLLFINRTFPIKVSAIPVSRQGG